MSAPNTEYRVTVSRTTDGKRVARGAVTTNYQDAETLRDVMPIASDPRIEARLVTEWQEII